METMNNNTGNFFFEEIYTSNYASVTYCAELKMAVCTATVEYIPIHDFKIIFISISGLIEVFPIRYFLFDKRNLRTFHQPSMEWYFAIWKPEIKKKGLSNHYKILPDLDWFVKAVEAGKHEVFQKYGREILDGIQITYAHSPEEVIKNVAEHSAAGIY